VIILNFQLASLLARLKAGNIDGIAVIIRDKAGREQVMTAGVLGEPQDAIQACLRMAVTLADAQTEALPANNASAG